MQALRVTEKALALISSKSIGPLRVGKKPYKKEFGTNVTSFRSYGSCKTSRLATYRSCGIPFKIREARINLSYQSTLRNSVSLEFPLTNPKKHSSESTTDPALETIMPLTDPTFSGKKGFDFPSVTKVLQATMPSESLFVLERWKETMIKKLGFAGFQKYQHDTFERGRLLHELVANLLLGRGQPNVDNSKEVVANLWKSIKNTVNEKISNPRMVEHIVTHKEMNYRGIVDCVAFYKGELSVIDFKTAEKPKKNVESLYDNPLQVSAYCGAINNDITIPVKVIDRNITAGLLIVAYVDGSEADTFFFNQEQISDTYWKQWLIRLDQYNRMPDSLKNKKKQDINAKKAQISKS